MRLNAFFAAAGLLLALPLAVAAAPQSAASLGNLTVWVYDLNPLDGISPSFSIVSGLGDSTTTSAWIDPGSSDTHNGGLNLLSDVIAGGSHSQATLVGGINLGSLLLSAQSQASSSVSAQTTALAELDLQLLLSANTLLLVSGDASVSASASTTTPGEQATAWVDLSFFDASNGVSLGNVGYASASSGIGGQASSAASMTISTALMHTGTNSRSVRLNASASTGAISQVSAVPEPGSYLLMGAGLLGLGAWTRRRQRI